jgi:hypothetical protein
MAGEHLRKLQVSGVAQKLCNGGVARLVYGAV